MDAIGGVGDVRVPALHVALRPADGAAPARHRAGALQRRRDRRRRAAAAPAGRPTRHAHAPRRRWATSRRSRRSWAPTPSAFDSARASSTVDRARLALAARRRGRRATGSPSAATWPTASRSRPRPRSTAPGSARSRATCGARTPRYGQLSLRELTAAGGYDSTLALDLKPQHRRQRQGGDPGPRHDLRARATRCARSSSGSRWTKAAGTGRSSGRRAWSSARGWRSTAWRSGRARAASR